MAKRTMAKTDRAIRKTVQSLPKKQSKVTVALQVGEHGAHASVVTSYI